MPQLQNTEDIISKFHLYVGDDESELSSDEELDLAQQITDEIYDDRDWEFLRKQASGTAVTAAGITTITVPSDFRRFTINHNMTDNSDFNDDNQSPKVIYMGTNRTAFKVINFADRGRYYNMQGYVYFDAVNNQIVFTQTPTTDTLVYVFDYIYRPAALDLTTGPVFPKEHYYAVAYGMAVNDMMIQLFDKARSYQKENNIRYLDAMSRLRYYNAGLRND